MKENEQTSCPADCLFPDSCDPSSKIIPDECPINHCNEDIVSNGETTERDSNDNIGVKFPIPIPKSRYVQDTVRPRLLRRRR